MSEHDGAKPPTAWLDHLHEAGHWERLIEVASESLALDPNDPETHRQIAWAYASTHRLPELKRHVDFLLHVDSEEPRHHHLAAIYFLEAKRPKQAAAHLESLLRADPNSATYHYLACIHALRTNKLKKAQSHIEQARAAAPDWAPALHLQIRMDGIHQTRAREAWARIRRLEEGLSLDPQDAAIMTTIGEIYLRELHRPRDAEGFFRQALFVDPSNKERQLLLLESIRLRSLLYRTLSLPLRAGLGTLKALRENRLRLVLLIVCFKAVLIFVTWMMVVGAFFTPAAKVFEWLILADLPRTKPWPRCLSWLSTVSAWPLGVRVSVCLSLIGGAWTLILWKMTGLQMGTTLQILAWVFGVHFFFVAVLAGYRRLRARHGRAQESRRRQRELIESVQAGVV